MAQGEDQEVTDDTGESVCAEDLVTLTGLDDGKLQQFEGAAAAGLAARRTNCPAEPWKKRPPPQPWVRIRRSRKKKKPPPQRKRKKKPRFRPKQPRFWLETAR